MREQTFYQLLHDEYGKWVLIDDWLGFCWSSQEDKVWWHLKTFGNITNLICRTIYGIGHTPSVIRNIRENPLKYGENKYKIMSEPEKGADRWGKKSHWVKYVLTKIEGSNIIEVQNKGE